jgi:hypothetical protein
MEKRNIIIVSILIILILGLGFTSFYFFKKYIESEESKPASNLVETQSSSDVRQEIENTFGYKETCFDSDSGKNYSTQGYVISYRTDTDYQTEEYSHGSFEKRFDYCVSSLDDGEYVESSKYLVENYCEGNSESSQKIECENICQEGVCT